MKGPGSKMKTLQLFSIGCLITLTGWSALFAKNDKPESLGKDPTGKTIPAFHIGVRTGYQHIDPSLQEHMLRSNTLHQAIDLSRGKLSNRLVTSNLTFHAIPVSLTVALYSQTEMNHLFQVDFTSANVHTGLIDARWENYDYQNSYGSRLNYTSISHTVDRDAGIDYASFSYQYRKNIIDRFFIQTGPEFMRRSFRMGGFTDRISSNYVDSSLSGSSFQHFAGPYGTTTHGVLQEALLWSVGFQYKEKFLDSSSLRVGLYLKKDLISKQTFTEKTDASIYTISQFLSFAGSYIPTDLERIRPHSERIEGTLNYRELQWDLGTVLHMNESLDLSIVFQQGHTLESLSNITKNSFSDIDLIDLDHARGGNYLPALLKLTGSPGKTPEFKSTESDLRIGLNLQIH